MALPQKTGFKRLINAFWFSIGGFRACLKEEAFRQEVILACILVPTGIWIGATPAEKSLLAGSIFLVLLMEVLNSAIERAIDRISFERHELSKEAKDMGSAAVFLSIAMAILVWALIAGPKVF